MGTYDRKAACLSLAVWSAFFVMVSAEPSAAAEVLLEGATTFNTNIIVPYQSEIERKSGHTLKVTVNKSSAGLIAILERRADLGMISAPLENEIEATRKLRSDLVFDNLRSFEISRVRVGFATNQQNPVRKASLDTIRRILTGEIKNWKELGGPDLPIRLVAVRGGGGTTTTVESQLLGGEALTAPNVIYVQNGSQVGQVVEQEPAALGIAQLSLLRKRNLPEIATDRVIEQQLNFVSAREPTPEMLQVIKATRQVVAGLGG